MIDNVVNNELITNNSIKQQQELLGVEKKSVSQNPYDNTVEFTDQSDISDTALRLYEKEKEAQKYRELVLESISEGMNTNDIVKLINNNYKYISNDDLAESLLKSQDFMDLLMGDIEIPNGQDLAE